MIVALAVVCLALWAIVRGRPTTAKAPTQTFARLSELIDRRCDLVKETILCADAAAKSALEVDLKAWAAAEQIEFESSDGEMHLGSRHFAIELAPSRAIEITPRPAPAATPTAKTPARATPQRTSAPAQLERGKLAIILDDAGQNADGLDTFLQLPKEIAVAVLPHLPISSRWSQQAAANGHQVMLHLPMQPEDPSWDPGEGAILVGMSDKAIDLALSAALASVAEASGFNNHMGSMATADQQTMHALMRAAASRRLFFVDSRTIATSLAEHEAHLAGLATASRHVFLDNEAETDAILQQLDEAVAIALRDGHAIAIGHVYPITLELLAERLPELDPRIDLVQPSTLTR